ncbi:MAG: type II toxin-antitoxin system VapB family antitoxin [Candidatus Nanopelagicales bacterium]|nr:type II toxin-antitoxin system VapB family antitoxin [Candidatus Nanopelagicales bacterium]
MAVTIKNAVAEQLIRELAALTGETKTEALTRATRERLDRLKRSGRRERIDRAARDFRESVATGEPLSSESLYDESGLPK